MCKRTPSVIAVDRKSAWLAWLAHLVLQDDHPAVILLCNGLVALLVKSMNGHVPPFIHLFACRRDIQALGHHSAGTIAAAVSRSPVFVLKRHQTTWLLCVALHEIFISTVTKTVSSLKIYISISLWNISRMRTLTWYGHYRHEISSLLAGDHYYKYKIQKIILINQWQKFWLQQWWKVVIFCRPLSIIN